MEIKIELFGIDLLVYGNYIPEEEETNSPADFEIQAVILMYDSSQTDFLDLLQHHEAKIKELVIEIIEE